MAVRQGTSIVWGVSTTDLTGFTAAVSGGIETISEGIDYAVEEVVLKDRLGRSVTTYHWDPRTELTLKCYPKGPDENTAPDVIKIPEPGERVIVTAGSDSDIDGTYVCRSVSRARANEAHVEFDLTLTKFPQIDPNTAANNTIYN